MTIRQMVIELYTDMKIMRPQVDLLSAQRLDPRISVLEMENRERITAASVAKATTDSFFNFGKWALGTVLSIGAILVMALSALGLLHP